MSARGPRSPGVGARPRRGAALRSALDEPGPCLPHGGPLVRRASSSRALWCCRPPNPVASVVLLGGRDCALAPRQVWRAFRLMPELACTAWLFSPGLGRRSDPNTGLWAWGGERAGSVCCGEDLHGVRIARTSDVNQNNDRTDRGVLRGF